MKDERVLVVGAGPTGLGASIALAKRNIPVELVDRIPVPGGSHGWDNPGIRQLVSEAVNAGVTISLGQAVLSWQAPEARLVSPDGARTVHCRHLIHAAGLRPATVTELGIAGDRPAGVLPATVVEHLLDAGVRLWQEPLLLGEGPWVDHIDAKLKAMGCSPIRLLAPPDPLDRSGEGLLSRPWSATSIVGRTRIRALSITTADGTTDIACDALVLGADPRPVRNVDGAVDEQVRCVTHIQPLEEISIPARRRLGADNALAWLDREGSGGAS